ncbi:MAG: hypothetical protein ACRCSP_04290 [Rhodoglobus sp.]
MRKLTLRRPAAENRAYYREHDPIRSAAHEKALDSIRDGTGRNRAIRASKVPGYLTAVVILGRVEEDIIVWELEHTDDGERVVILWLGPLDM